MKSKFNFNVGSKGVQVVMVDKDNCAGLTCAYLAKLRENDWFKGEIGETYFIPEHPGNGEQRLLLGLGKLDELTLDDLRLAAFKLAKTAYANSVKELDIKIEKMNNLCMRRSTQAICEGIWRADYAFDQYKTDKKEQEGLIVNLTVPAEKLSKIQHGFTEMQDLMTAIEFTQELANQPANVIYPETMAAKCKSTLETVGVKVEIMGRKECEALGMGAYLAVASGSAREPQFVVATYEGAPESDERLGLVGKGITYDSGGYSIKPTDGMLTMHDDMTGGATVMGALYAIAKRGLKVNVVAATALCENMLSGNSYKPGDIVKSMSGKTIEIANTDAEGRVTLADSVYYVSSKCKVTKIIDIATLTGACLVALGEEFTGVVCNDQEFYQELAAAAAEADEKIWQLPSSKTFKEMNKSKRADLKNIGGRFGGTVTAGLFVGEFVADNLPWLHLDIAGTAYLSAPQGYLPEFATGTQVKTFYYLAKNSSKEQCGCQR